MTASEPYSSAPRTGAPGDGDPVASSASVIDEIERQLGALELAGELPGWVQMMPMPPGWQIGRIEGAPSPASRVALYAERPADGWLGCETLSVFESAGVPRDLLRDKACRTLRDLGADGVTTYPLDAPPDPRVAATRTTGYFNAGGRRLWAQYSSYVAASNQSGAGLLVEHAIFVDAAARARLRYDIDEMSDAVHAAFLEQIATVDTSETSPAPTEGPSDGT